LAETGTKDEQGKFQWNSQVIDWNTIIKEHGPAVWQTAYRLLGNHADAADCFQETFVSALGFCRRQRVLNFSAFLARLATARAIDQLRRQFRHAQSRTDFGDCNAVECDKACPHQQAERRELVEKVRQSISELTPQEAQVFCLRYLNELSYQQIAQQLSITTNSVGVLLHRARARLRESVEMLIQE
jgi:RNA polymerase sigma-70 factor (ECF subfamily)